MERRLFDEQMAALDALKGRPLDVPARVLIKKMLGNRSNLLVAKAARLAEENALADLMPDLLAAYDRFFTNPEKSDPQCWAKNALSRALAALECRDKDVFLRGLRHHQMEPTWGGRSDSAAGLRANCAHALVACEGLDNQELLVLLLDPLLDKDKSVRVEAARAIGQVGALAVAVLRLRALIPGEEPEVLAACFAALLAIERDAAIPFVAGFLDAEDGSAGEAAFALAETHSPVALAALLKRQSRPKEAWLVPVLLSAIALTRLPAAIDSLIAMIAGDAYEAPMAVEAIGRSAPSEQTRARVWQAVEQSGSPRLKNAFHEHFTAQE